jgi:hypothetical protein
MTTVLILVFNGDACIPFELADSILAEYMDYYIERLMNYAD